MWGARAGSCSPRSGVWLGDRLRGAARACAGGCEAHLNWLAGEADQVVTTAERASKRGSGKRAAALSGKRGPGLRGGRLLLPSAPAHADRLPERPRVRGSPGREPCEGIPCPAVPSEATPRTPAASQGLVLDSWDAGSPKETMTFRVWPLLRDKLSAGSALGEIGLLKSTSLSRGRCPEYPRNPST